ncbi:MAG: single-stranded DNA-binding protein [bacterium]|nr:single-stranded DNA-binding protein [bacterium]
MYLNKVFILGNLTRDPELKALPSGTKVTQFSLATNRVWRDQQGAKQEDTQYHNVVVFGRQAETTAQFVKKGDSVLVEGRIQTRSWDGTDGQKRYRTEVVADRVQFGPKRGSGGSFTPAQKDEAGGSDQGGGKMPEIEYPEEDINPDDIPF